MCMGSRKEFQVRPACSRSVTTYQSSLTFYHFSSIYVQSRASFSSTTSLAASPNISVVSKIIFIIDDVHFADESSLKHLLTLGGHSRSLLILSMKPPRNNNNNKQSNTNILHSISTDSRVYLRRLIGLEPRYLATLGTTT